jgi:hypothetical protein
MMRCLLPLLAIGIATATTAAAAAAATTSRQEFNSFKEKFGKVYASPQEEEFRFKIFQVYLYLFMLYLHGFPSPVFVNV